MVTEENTELVTIESSPKWRGTLIEEEHPEEQENDGTGNIPSTSAVNIETPVTQRKRRRSKDEIKVSPPIRRKRTRSVAATEAARERWATLEAQIEFPILKPKLIDAPQGLVEEEPQIEGLLFENWLLKEEVQALRKELENWKEACRKQGERKLHTLVEVADQLEGSNPTEAGNEEERVVYPTCGEIFNESGYKVIICAFTTQQFAPTTVEGQGQPNLRDDGTPKKKLHGKEIADEQDVVT